MQVYSQSEVVEVLLAQHVGEFLESKPDCSLGLAWCLLHKQASFASTVLNDPSLRALKGCAAQLKSSLKSALKSNLCPVAVASLVASNHATSATFQKIEVINLVLGGYSTECQFPQICLQVTKSLLRFAVANCPQHVVAVDNQHLLSVSSTVAVLCSSGLSLDDAFCHDLVTSLSPSTLEHLLKGSVTLFAEFLHQESATDSIPSTHNEASDL